MVTHTKVSGFNRKTTEVSETQTFFSFFLLGTSTVIFIYLTHLSSSNPFCSKITDLTLLDPVVVGKRGEVGCLMSVGPIRVWLWCVTISAVFSHTLLHTKRPPNKRKVTGYREIEKLSVEIDFCVGRIKKTLKDFLFTLTNNFDMEVIHWIHVSTPLPGLTHFHSLFNRKV